MYLLKLTDHPTMVMLQVLVLSLLGLSQTITIQYTYTLACTYRHSPLTYLMKWLLDQTSKKLSFNRWLFSASKFSVNFPRSHFAVCFSKSCRDLVYNYIYHFQLLFYWSSLRIPKSIWLPGAKRINRPPNRLYWLCPKYLCLHSVSTLKLYLLNCLWQSNKSLQGVNALLWPWVQRIDIDS